MTLLNAIIQQGPTVLMPIIFCVFGLFLKIKITDALVSSIKIGVGFLGISVVTSLITDSMIPLMSKIATRLQWNLSIVDVGWPTATNIAFKSYLGLLIVPLCFSLNFMLIKLKISRTINIDIWNYWHFSFLAVAVTNFTNSIILGIAAALCDFIVINYFADWSASSVASYYHLEKTSFPNSFTLCFFPIIKLLANILNTLSSKTTKKVTFQLQLNPVIISLVLGILLGKVAAYPFAQCLYLGIIFCAIILLIPTVSQLLGEGLMPIADALKERASSFKQSNILIGLTPSLVIGNQSLVITMALLLPISILLAYIIPNNQFLPVASLSGLIYLLPLIISTTKGSIIKSTIIGTVILFIAIVITNITAPIITFSAQKFALVTVNDGLITSLDYGVSPLFLMTTWLQNHQLFLLLSLLAISTYALIANYRLTSNLLKMD